MLARIVRSLEQEGLARDGLAGLGTAPATPRDDAVRLAAAALLVEVIRADHASDPREEAALMEVLAREFQLGSEALEALAASAEAEQEDAVSLYQFTSVVNRHFDRGARLRLVEHMWRIAFADDMLDRYEEHLIRRVADLLHLSHTDFIAAKIRVRDEREFGSGRHGR